MEPSMTIVNIGGTGFIGSSLTAQLLERGEDVVCFDLRAGTAPDAATVVEGDVTEYEALVDVIETYEPDAIAHLAYVLTAESQENLALATRVNCIGTDNVFRAAVEHDVDRVVYASSIAALGWYGEYDEPIDEDVSVPAALSQFPRMSLYGATKQFNEFQGREYARQHDIEIAGIRPTVVFGPGRERGRSAWASEFVTNPARGTDGLIACRPEQPLNMVYRDDVARLFAAVLGADSVSHPVYLTGGHRITAQALADRVESIVGGTVSCDPDAPEMELVSDVRHDRARDEFGYELTPLDDAIRHHADSVT